MIMPDTPLPTGLMAYHGEINNEEGRRDSIAAIGAPGSSLSFSSPTGAQASAGSRSGTSMSGWAASTVSDSFSS